MSCLPDEEILCPYCGESQTVTVDFSEGNCDYIEDCQICCRPIDFHLMVDDDGGYQLQIKSENESGF
ncbi:CPXCG motif-containing cysteine-rich protein [Sessilibacter sp. MAH1]